MNRPTILQALQTATESKPWAIALWQGGSASFGRLDAYSDIDLCLGVEDGHVAEAFATIEAALREIAPIEALWEASPLSERQSQRFYRLAGVNPWLMIDLSVLSRSVPPAERYTERRRHGEPNILFDRDNFTADTPADPEAWRARLRQRLHLLRGRVDLLGGLPLKSALRGDDAEAVAFYQAFVLRPLTELLRIRHDPWRHDFDVRYLCYDLPTEERERLTALWFLRDLEDLRSKHQEALQWFWQLMHTLEKEEPCLKLT